MNLGSLKQKFAGVEGWKWLGGAGGAFLVYRHFAKTPPAAAAAAAAPGPAIDTIRTPIDPTIIEQTLIPGAHHHHHKPPPGKIPPHTQGGKDPTEKPKKKKHHHHHHHHKPKHKHVHHHHHHHHHKRHRHEQQRSSSSALRSPSNVLVSAGRTAVGYLPNLAVRTRQEERPQPVTRPRSRTRP